MNTNRATASAVCLELDMGYGTSSIAPGYSPTNYTNPVTRKEHNTIWLDYANLVCSLSLIYVGQFRLRVRNVKFRETSTQVDICNVIWHFK